MIDLVFKNYTLQKSPGRGFFKNILEIVAKELKFKDEVEVSVNLVGEAKIRALNKKYRHKDKATDVLSFPMQSGGLHRPEGAKRLEGPFEVKSLDQHFVPSSGSRELSTEGLRMNKSPIDLGDLFICLSIAKNEAKRENITIREKLAQLTVHGFLHLSGYNHEKSKNDADVMFRIEGKILNKLDKK